MKEAGLRIRLEPNLRDEFIKTCHDKHLPAAQVLREFMRTYVANNKSSSAKRISRTNSNKKT